MGADGAHGVRLERLLCPSWRADLLARPRLVSRLAGGVDANRLTALCAPAGYGKTTLLADYLRQSDLRCIWLRLEDSDRDPVQLLQALSSAVDAADASGHETREAAPIGGWWTSAKRVTAVDLANRIASRHVHTLIALDDLHLIGGSPGAVRTIGQMLRLTPDHVRFVVSGRHEVPPALGQMAPLSGVAALDGRELRFTRDEIEELLDGLGVPVDFWSAFVDELAVCEGWPAAVTLAVQAKLLGHEGPQPTGGARDVWSGDSGALFGALAASILDELAPEDRRLLHEAAHLERMTPELCEACLGLPRAREWLARVSALNLFLDHRAGDEAYRMHTLFRQYLTVASPDRRPFTPEQHRLAAGYFEESGDVVPEITHSIEAGDLERSASRLAEVAPELARGSRWHTLADLISRYERASDGNLTVTLARYMAQAQVAVGDAQSAVSTVVIALDRPGLGDDDRVALLITSGYAHRSWGAMDEALRDAEAALGHATALAPAERVKVLRVIGQIHASELRMGLAGRYLYEAAELAQASELPRASALALLDIASFELLCGRFAEAERHARAAAELAATTDYLEASLLSRINVAEALHLSGQFAEALHESEKVLEATRRHEHRQAESLAYVVLGDVHADLLATDDAERCFRQGLALARELDEASLVAHAMLSLAAVHREAGRLAESRNVLSDPEVCETRGDKLAAVLFGIEDAALRSAEGNHALAVEGLRSTVETLRGTGALASLAAAQLALAQAMFAAEGISAAVPVLEGLAATIDDIGGQQCLIARALRTPRMWGALEAHGRADLRSAITEPDLRPRTSPEKRGLPTTAHPGDPLPRLLTPREREVVIALCEGLARDAIADRLGLSRSTIDKTISSTYASTGFRHAHQLVAWAFRCGLYDPANPPSPQTETQY